MMFTQIKPKLGVPKYKQIIIAIEKAIANKLLSIGDQLPSVSKIQKENKVSRDTVLTALSELKTRGIIESVAGKGYYVLSEDIKVDKKIFVLFDELNAFKEDLYNSLLKNLDEHTEVDIYFHHFNKKIFQKLIFESVGNYSSYVIMPANLKDTLPIIAKLPQDRVYILDQIPLELEQYSGIYQDFEKSMYQNLEKGLKLIEKYQKLNLVFSSKYQPQTMLKGYQSFCKDYNMLHDVITSVEDQTLKKGEIYIVPDDRNLIRIVKKIREQGLVLTKDIGIISYNDTLLKEIVEGGITTISTDFKEMGSKLAHMINNNEQLKIENTSSLILRKSL